ncbi:unnamed protein product [Withania somnifera]
METGKEKMEKKEDKDDPMDKAREIIREAIISDGQNYPNNSKKKKEGAEEIDDVLAFSRTVQKKDSSLE